jgi:hypothetical protein
MKGGKMLNRWGVPAAIVGIFCLLHATLGAQENEEPKPAPCYVGLRRSSYGLKARNGDDRWWVERAKEFAAQFLGATPVILEIVSGYQDDGSTRLEFARAAGDTEAIADARFGAGGVDHERALKACDEAGVKVLLQLEPGRADVAKCFAAVWQKFRAHPSIVGFAVDAEWYCTKESDDEAGKPIPDDEAKKWLEQVLSFNREFVLVLKHWDAKHMPASYRHPNLWFLTDSQEFESQAKWRRDMIHWARTLKDSTVGAQYGYEKDEGWWSKLERPPVELGQVLRKDLPNCRCLLWVDFTADRAKFK